MPPDPTDSRNTIVEIRAGAGFGIALFAADLYRMYPLRETMGWQVETMDSSSVRSRWFREIIFQINGRDVYKAPQIRERCASRATRVPPPKPRPHPHQHGNGRRCQRREEVDVQIKPDEIEVNVCRSSGKGGQGVNTTDSAVQIIHKPTGMIVRCADGRSQIRIAPKRWWFCARGSWNARSRKKTPSIPRNRKDQVGTGERSEKDPHLQLSAEPRHRSPHRSHALQSGELCERGTGRIDQSAHDA